MKIKRTFYTEWAYVAGIVMLALGTALMERADFGVSMVVAPAYLIHLKVSQFLPFFSFGMAEYTLQAVLLIAMIVILKRFKKAYLFSFVTAVIYGMLLDFLMYLITFIPYNGYALRIVFFLLGMQCCSFGVSMFFHTYISAEVYEMFVKEISQKYNINIHKFKTGYDCVSCIVAVLLSFIFFGMWHFEGVKLGTVLCALVNGFIIGMYSRLFEKHFEFKDKFKLRKYF